MSLRWLVLRGLVEGWAFWVELWSFVYCRVCIVSFKENANAGSLIQPALQFSHIEKRFPMLTEGSTMEYSLLFSLESLCECYGWFAAAFWPDFCKGWTCV
jgi:hypothetical protein